MPFRVRWILNDTAGGLILGLCGLPLDISSGQFHYKNNTQDHSDKAVLIVLAESCCSRCNEINFAIEAFMGSLSNVMVDTTLNGTAGLILSLEITA